MALLTAQDVSQSFGALDLFSGVNVSIPKDGKIGLVGPNGIGKTTLLLILAGMAQPATGEVHVARKATITYLPQEAEKAFAGHDNTIYEEMLAVFVDLRAQEADLRAMEQEMATDSFSDELFERYSRAQVQFELAGGYEYDIRIRQVLTGLGFPEDKWQIPLQHLSGGQKTRVLLARLLLEQPDLLILDEPTNHLDVQAIEWLEGALRGWDGAVLLVSHDRYFLDRNVDFLVHFGETEVSGRYPAPFSSYQQLRREAEKAAIKQRVVIERPSRAAGPAADEARRLSWREKQELQQLEQEIAGLEGDKETLVAAINASGEDYQQLQELAGRLEATDTLLEQKLERWLELAVVADAN